MEFLTYGKPDNPAVLILCGEEQRLAHGPGLKKLEKHYYLLVARFTPEEPADRRLDAIEDCLGYHFAGRIWGAYGLDEGATLLLELIARQRITIRTAVVDGAMAIPVSLPPDSPTRLVYWYGSRDKAAKKQLNLLQGICPGVYTLRLKKLRAGERFGILRPDLWVKRLKKTYGAARLLTHSAVLKIDAPALWAYLESRDHAAAENLTNPRVHSCPETYTLVLEGKSKLSRHWSHLLHLEALEPNLTLCTHQLELDSGLRSSLAAARAKALLKKEHKIWKQTLNPKPAKGFFFF